MIIGLGHQAQVGKDTVGEFLEETYGYARTSFAHNLKEAAKNIFGWDDRHVHGDLKEVLDTFWGFTPRWALQNFGTEACMPVFGKDIWIKSLERQVVGDPLGRDWVITDVRFPAEAEIIKEWGGKVVRIDRPNREKIKTSGHVSEVALNEYEDWDHVLDNSGNFSELYRGIQDMLVALEGWGTGDEEV